MHWYPVVLKKYARFEGRAGREEFWLFTLIHWLVIAGIATAGTLLALAYDSAGNVVTVAGQVLLALYLLSTAVPCLSVSARRFHDVDRSAWNLLLLLIPVFGTFLVIAYMAERSYPYENRHGQPGSRIDMDNGG